MTTYTQSIQNYFFDETHTAAENMNYEKLCALLSKGGYTFRSFGETVLFYMRWGINGEIQNPYRQFCAMAENKGIDPDNIVSKETWKNWMKGSRPSDRAVIFKIAYVLGLNAETTKEFMQKALFQRGFDSRSVADAVFYYGLAHGLEFKDVNALYEQAKKAPEDANAQATKSIHSTKLENCLQRIFFDAECNDEAILTYCSMLSGSHERLKQTVSDLLKKDGDLFGAAQAEFDVRKERLRVFSEFSLDKSSEGLSYEHFKEVLLEMEALKERLSKMRTNDPLPQNEISVLPELRNVQEEVSNQQLLNIVLGYSVDGRSGNSSSLLSLITANLPSADNIGEMQNQENNNAVKLRKALILFESYLYWNRNSFECKACPKCKGTFYVIKDHNECPTCQADPMCKDYTGYTADGVLAEYRNHIDDILKKCGVQPLYAGDPFDLLFLVCAVPDISSPIEKFRWIVDRAQRDDARQRRVIEIIQRNEETEDNNLAEKSKNDNCSNETVDYESYREYLSGEGDFWAQCTKIVMQVLVDLGKSSANEELIKELIQVGLIAIWQKITEYDPKKSKFSTYIYNSAKWAILNELDKDKKYYSNLAINVLQDEDELDRIEQIADDSEPSSDSASDPEAEYLDRQQKQQTVDILAAMQRRLSKEDADLLNWRFMEKMTDMAEIQAKFKEKHNKDIDVEDLRRAEARAYRLLCAIVRAKEKGTE